MAVAMQQLTAAIYVLNWIFFSSVVIFFNKWLLDKSRFPYPALLTTWHLLLSTLITNIMARTTTLLDGRHKARMNGRLYLRAVVPIGVFYSLSLVCSNVVYVYLSVAFAQMLKAAAPVTVLLASWAFSVSEPHMGTLINILIIVFGVAIASFAELDFNLTGFLFQMGGLIFEAIRLVLVQKLLMGGGAAAPTSKTSTTGVRKEGDVELAEGEKDEDETSERMEMLDQQQKEAAQTEAASPQEKPYKMDPLVSLYYFAPVCCALNFFFALLTEVPSFNLTQVSANVGLFALLANGSVAFFLNLASLMLIGKTSSLVLTLSGTLKNILIIVVSVVIWHTQVSGMQVFGYGVALLALTYYALGWEGCKSLLPAGVVGALGDERIKALVSSRRGGVLVGCIGGGVVFATVLWFLGGVTGGVGEGYGRV